MKAKAPTNGYTTEANNSSSPPTSPRRHSSLPHWRRGLQPCKSQHAYRRRQGYIPAIVLRRKLIRYLLFLPLLYVSVVITCAGPLSAILYPPQPGSMYRSHEVFRRLWPQIQADNSSLIELSSLWKYKRKLKEQKPCLNRTAAQRLDHVPDRYLMVEANGGLNQQRSSICNAVALAGLLNATLVIPSFDYHNLWKDRSKFRDIYDEDHFISMLEGHVKVVRDLPKKVIEKYDFNVSNIPELHVPAWSPASYYMEDVYTLLHKEGVIRISPFANRLAMNLPPYIQSLRCLANYEALRFSLPISTLARKLVDRMIERSSSTGGKYVSIHLRFEEDMVAFSCCVYYGGKLEKSEMDKIRESGWHGKFTHKDRIIDPGLNRINGKCPMTPLEVGMMLRGMGFASETPIYLASGKIYHAEKNLAPLLTMFPLLQTKESLTNQDELALFQSLASHQGTMVSWRLDHRTGNQSNAEVIVSGHSSRLAALDYMVCLLSDVFVTTQGGNFPHFLMGHRRFLYNGHAKTIKPDKNKFVVLLHNTTISWEAFKDEMRVMLAESDRKGIMVPRVKKSNRKASVYSNPLPECRCLWESQNWSFRWSHTSHVLYHNFRSSI